MNSIQSHDLASQGGAIQQTWLAPQNPPSDGSTSYTVRPNDSFYGIADSHLRHHGVAHPSPDRVFDYAQQIAAHNDLTLESMLFPGDRLSLPPVSNNSTTEPTPSTPQPPQAQAVVNVDDGVDTTEAAYVLNRHFDAIDSNDNGSLSEGEIRAYAAGLDPASGDGVVIEQILGSRSVDGGLYQEVGYGNRTGEYGDEHISAKDIAITLSTAPMPPFQDAQTQAAFIDAQLGAIERAVAEDGYGEDKAADLVTQVIYGNAAALANPEVVRHLDLDRLAAGAEILAAETNDPALLTRMSQLLGQGIDHKHQANLDTDSLRAISALANVFERYLELEGGGDAQTIADATQTFIVDSRFGEAGFDAHTLGVVSGALMGGALDRVHAITDDKNRRNGLFRGVLEGLSSAASIAAAAAGPATAVLWTGLSEYAALSTRFFPEHNVDTGPLYVVQGELRLAFEELDAAQDPRDPDNTDWVAWSEADINAATRGLDIGLTLSGYPS